MLILFSLISIKVDGDTLKISGYNEKRFSFWTQMFSHVLIDSSLFINIRSETEDGGAIKLVINELKVFLKIKTSAFLDCSSSLNGGAIHFNCLTSEYICYGTYFSKCFGQNFAFVTETSEFCGTTLSSFTDVRSNKTRDIVFFNSKEVYVESINVTHIDLLANTIRINGKDNHNSDLKYINIYNISPQGTDDCILHARQYNHFDIQYSNFVKIFCMRIFLQFFAINTTCLKYCVFNELSYSSLTLSNSDIIFVKCYFSLPLDLAQDSFVECISNTYAPTNEINNYSYLDNFTITKKLTGLQKHGITNHFGSLVFHLSNCQFWDMYSEIGGSAINIETSRFVLNIEYTSFVSCNSVSFDKIIRGGAIHLCINEGRFTMYSSCASFCRGGLGQFAFSEFGLTSNSEQMINNSAIMESGYYKMSQNQASVVMNGFLVFTNLINLSNNINYEYCLTIVAQNASVSWSHFHNNSNNNGGCFSSYAHTFASFSNFIGNSLVDNHNSLIFVCGKISSCVFIDNHAKWVFLFYQNIILLNCVFDNFSSQGQSPLTYNCTTNTKGPINPISLKYIHNLCQIPTSTPPITITQKSWDIVLIFLAVVGLITGLIFFLSWNSTKSRADKLEAMSLMGQTITVDFG